ncbi:MAG: protein translocase subunit SecF [Zetaproteobacteria bacterium CG12_big_fil_rev_8_21_14_0_65_55_1124]|nr:MAG: protein-export membrane protein SecF [Zetaproteobacteria bacterium CG1_02_55_237]PIS19974.1 MAG: protein translocase subunit SecF [Zetaproteobacteria bacterium CG08_land_8_20_14_0_20_55_17]PIW43604.1 MAG: protein translocase subunit SecF [Zetaproteobacteria bacterium CG12_big_fil_rev_8_21_14_0_65_55_1124]PIY52728.1 MAG: protein translocase subunit SecF [Zetaproteobacteria bacterium CG_4_10_14_0_8_um_filter_55_43]PIZ37912.1 MAG: protein translocase subunit SecF [Zetaproteobacteria bacter
MQLIRPDTHIDFIGRRKIAMAISGLVLLISVGLLVTKGLNFGIDFTGGTLVEVKFTQAPKISDIRTSLSPAGYEQAIIQEFGSPEEILIRVQNNDGEKSAAISTAILDTLSKDFGADAVEMRRVEFVGPQVGDELTRAGIMAVLIAMLAILVYVTVRFELRFALGADAALVHDVTIVLGLFALGGKEFTLPVVAALLTVIGYSLNDTIVVFDRIRENLAANRKKKYPDEESHVANASINQTLGRTIMTSLTTLLVVIALFFLGGEVIHDFAFALIAGIVVGTYSSIFIASPIMLSLQGKFKIDEEEAKRLEARP